MLFDLRDYYVEIAAYFRGFLSALVLSDSLLFGLMVAGVGAFAGAVGAQVIAYRQDRRRSALEELAATNQAAIVAFSIFNAYANLKEQHIAYMILRYKMERIAFLKKISGKGFRKKDTVLFDFETLTAPVTLVDELVRLIGGLKQTKSINLINAVDLQSSIETFESTLHSRNNLITAFEQFKGSEDEKMCRYFGIQIPNTFILDRRHHDTIEQIYEGTNSILGFSYIITRAMSQEAHRKRRSARRWFRDRNLPAARVDLRIAKEKGVFPDLELFRPRLEEQPLPPPKPWWESRSTYEDALLAETDLARPYLEKWKKKK